jgi:hypothetical protein
MTTMIFEVYDAFLSVGVSEEKARKAAEAISNESLATKGDIARLEAVTKAEIAKLDKELAVLKWMMGVLMAGVGAQLVKVFFA